jgi:glyoxylase-like metal-dependent hydrolase (beta-lactamase superfamily II)
MKLGPYELSSVHTGEFALDGGSMFGVVPRTIWSKIHPPDEIGRIQLAVRALLIQGENRTIVVDTGVGRTWSEKLAKRYAISLPDQRLEEALNERGVSTEEVTDVILTHLHFDHAGGVTRWNAEGSLEATFPNARHHLQKANLEAATNPNGREAASYLEENYQPLIDAGLLDIIDGSKELFPGIHLILSNGHTTGQQLVWVEGQEGDEAGGLLYCGDVIPTRTHVPVAWHMGFDVRPLVIMDEKEHLLNRALAEDWLLFYEHDVEVAATRVQRNARGFIAGAEVII